MQVIRIDQTALDAAIELYRQQLLTGAVKLTKTKAKDKMNLFLKAGDSS